MATETKSAAPALSGWLDDTLMTACPEDLRELEEIVTDVGRSAWLWGYAVTFDAKRRSRRVLYKTPRLEIALCGWAAGQDTAFHDHGGASGAAFICSGLLVEDTIEAVDGHVVTRHSHTRRAETAFSFGPEYIHRVRHKPDHGLALSVHVYTPAGHRPGRLRSPSGRHAARPVHPKERDRMSTLPTLAGAVRRDLGSGFAGELIAPEDDRTSPMRPSTCAPASVRRCPR